MEKSQLRQIIKEEMRSITSEDDFMKEVKLTSREIKILLGLLYQGSMSSPGMAVGLRSLIDKLKKHK